MYLGLFILTSSWYLHCLHMQLIECFCMSPDFLFPPVFFLSYSLVLYREGYQLVSFVYTRMWKFCRLYTKEIIRNSFCKEFITFLVYYRFCQRIWSWYVKWSIDVKQMLFRTRNERRITGDKAIPTPNYPRRDRGLICRFPNCPIVKYRSSWPRRI